MFSASLSIASFDKKSGRGYHWTMSQGRLINCKIKAVDLEFAFVIDLKIIIYLFLFSHVFLFS